MLLVHWTSQPLLVVHFKQTSRKDGYSPWESSEYYLQVKQCLFLLLMENQEANPTKRSYQPSWVIQKDLALWPKQLSISCQRGLLARGCLLGKRLQKSLILFWPYSSVFPLTWSNLIIIHILWLWSLGYLITGCPFRFGYSCQHFRLQTLCLFALKRDILLRKFKDKESFTIYLDSLLCEEEARVTLWGFLEGAGLSNPNFIVSKPAIECLWLL